MIYRVGDNDHPGYDYSRQKPTQISGDGEKFSLDHRKEEFSPEKKEKGEDKKLHEKAPGAKLMEKSGVKLELSGSGTKSASLGAKNTTAQAADNASRSIFWESVRKTFTKLAQYAKTLFDKIWNDPLPEAESMDVTPEEAERYTQEYYALKGATVEGKAPTQTPESADAKEVTSPVNTENRDAEIQKYLRSGNLEQIISLLTDNGQRTVAKNSTLLTYYDKSGRLNPVNPSDSERILHGDRRTRQL